ncbi:hypothetical protein HNQ59_001348 [Chitinivorax tropicus]|uniref:Uncharacterized protein n=1 Tax=Chitinivorax tropicus TaxID=714531 RepID=A0A840MPF6_9PROT|nr:hypothetical protein [Chitinivorax tropicus]
MPPKNHSQQTNKKNLQADDPAYLAIQDCGTRS